MDAREKILGKLRAARTPFEDVLPVEEKRHTVPVTDASPAALYERFVQAAKAMTCVVHEAASQDEALQVVLDMLGDDKQVLMWDAEHIPLAGLAAALEKAGVQRASVDDAPTVRVGITGVDAALAATGSIAVVSGAGKSRQPSLLPLVHVAVMTRKQVVADLETFYKQLGREDYRNHSNIAVITGPSKSADIAMELIHGMHGPGEVHIVVVPGE